MEAMLVVNCWVAHGDIQDDICEPQCGTSLYCVCSCLNTGVLDAQREALSDYIRDAIVKCYTIVHQLLR